MHKMIQIRNVPTSLHRLLKVRAAKAGLSLSDYLLTELQRVAEQPTVDELWERIATRDPAEPGESAADAIRAERDARDEEGSAGEQRAVRGTGKRTKSA